MEKVEKIGTLEAIAFIIIVMINQIILNSPKNILTSTGSAAWLNVIFISILAIMFCLFVARLFSHFKNEDIIDISEFLGGKALKVIIGILYLILFLGVNTLLLRYFSECIRLIYYPTTPKIFIFLFFIVGSVLAVSRGISSVIRTNLIIMPFLLLSILIIFFSVSKWFVWERAFPIFGYGFDSTFLSGITNIFAFGGFANLYFLMPLLKNKENFKKISIISVVISSIYLFISVVCLLLTFSNTTTSQEIIAIYPLTRIIEYGRFFQRVDAIFIFLWILSAFCYLSTSLILITHIFKKLTYISNEKVMSLSFASIILGLALSINSFANAKLIQENIYKVFYLILAFVITPLILILANWKKRKKEKELSL